MVGAAFAIISVFVGDIFDFDFHVGDTHLPYVSPTTIATFVTVFGGSGYFLMTTIGLPGFLTATISICLAIAAAALMFFLVVVPLERAEKTAAYSAKEMIGKQAEVLTSIEGEHKGEIIYEQGSSRLSAPAMSAAGEKLDQGNIVTIVGESSGTFIVEKSIPGGGV